MSEGAVSSELAVTRSFPELAKLSLFLLFESWQKLSWLGICMHGLNSFDGSWDTSGLTKGKLGRNELSGICVHLDLFYIATVILAHVLEATQMR